MMKEILIFRHFKSSWADPNMRDFDRPLNQRGERSIPIMASRIEETNWKPDLIIYSAAKRTCLTYNGLIKELGWEKVHSEMKESFYLIDSASVIAELHTLDNKINKVMIIAHNPGMTDLVNDLSNSYLDNLPTGGMGLIDLPINNWKELKRNREGRLRIIEYPRMFM